MTCWYACNSPEHEISRRRFLGGAAAGALGLGGMLQPVLAGDLRKQRKQVLMIWLSGGVSQLETWDPKPGTNTGGPFRAIPTSVTGVHVCELLPLTAREMHRLALVRGVNTADDDHGRGAYIMHTGRRPEPRLEYPSLGAVCAKLLTPPHHRLPGYIHITAGGGGGLGKKETAFLGPKYAPVVLAGGKPPADVLRPAGLTEEADHRRNAFRERLNRRFTERRRTAETEVYTQAYEQAAQLMERRAVFDVDKEDPRDADRYGRHDFGRHCLLARRLLEHGVPFVKVTHSNYDTHHENFDFHIEQLGEFDQPFATLVQDLAQRGLLSRTLVVVLSEFGRTPTINRNFGRDHWSHAWSVALAGCGIRGGTVVGKTNANGTAVTDRQVHGGHLFHTYLRALGINSEKNHYIEQRPIPMADPKASEISEVLA
jgi:hypothetical protein